jgi:signal transduction histidine kinase
MFAIFIMACGATHFMSIWTLWRADYGIEAIIKACTALASVSTAVALWPLLPKAIALPSQAQLQSMNEDLRLRIDERDMALAALEKEKTERLATEDMLRQSQKMEAIGQLTGGIAHDFNNLLSIIIAGIERADRISSVSDERASRSLKAAIDAAEQASTLTHQLLAYSRRQTLQPVIQDLNSLVNSAAELSERTLGSNIALELDLTPQLPHVNVDGPQTVNAILNLIVNSRDAMPAGGKIKIKTYTREDIEGEEPRVVLEVSDDGLGMSRETASRAFEPYFTTKPLGKGTGLGLSQVYGFVTQSLGQIELESAESVGTVVRIILRGCKAK